MALDEGVTKRSSANCGPASLVPSTAHWNDETLIQSTCLPVASPGILSSRRNISRPGVAGYPDSINDGVCGTKCSTLRPIVGTSQVKLTDCGGVPLVYVASTLRKESVNSSVTRPVLPVVTKYESMRTSSRSILINSTCVPPLKRTV